MSSVVESPPSDFLARLQCGVLPAEGQALVAAGHNLGFVCALFPLSRVAAQSGLLLQLEAVTGFSSRDKVASFLSHLVVNWSRSHLSSNELEIMMGGVRSLDECAAAASEIAGTIGVDRFNAFTGMYRCLADAVYVLTVWLADREAFTGDQVATLFTVAAFWDAVLAFDADVPRN